MSIPSLVTQNPVVQIVTATKPLVDALLSMNTRNRKPKQSHLLKMASDMKSGDFFLTASGIGVSRNGVLLDGQNRLMAIREAGYPAVQFVLATGLAEESQRVVDRHAKRNLSDVLSMHMNITINTHMVALASALHFLGATRQQNFAIASGSSNVITDTDIADFMAEHGELAKNIVVTAKQARAPVLAAIFVYALHHEEKAMIFANKIATGVNLQEDDPAYRLRNYMERTKANATAAGRMETFKTAASACVSDYKEKSVKLLRPIDSWESAGWHWKIKGKDIFDTESE